MTHKRECNCNCNTQMHFGCLLHIQQWEPSPRSGYTCSSVTDHAFRHMPMSHAVVLTTISALRVVEVRLTEQDTRHSRRNPLVWFPANYMQVLSPLCCGSGSTDCSGLCTCAVRACPFMKKPEGVLASVACTQADGQPGPSMTTLKPCVRGLEVHRDATPISMTKACPKEENQA